jgi:hypothetical protein
LSPKHGKPVVLPRTVPRDRSYDERVQQYERTKCAIDDEEEVRAILSRRATVWKSLEGSRSG